MEGTSFAYTRTASRYRETGLALTVGRRSSSVKPEIVFACVALPIGVLLVGLTPPFEVPDEPNHFYRAYQLSEGGVVPERLSDSVGGMLPRSLQQVADAVIGSVPFNPDEKQNLEAWRLAFDVPLRPEDRAETPFPNTALSGPTAYAPQALGIALGRLSGASALALSYWGRVFNLVICVALTTLAIRLLPIRRWTCVLLGLLPLTLFVRSSLSSDGPTMALAMIALAICLRPTALGSDRADEQLPWSLVATTALMALGKPPYGAVSFLALATPPRLLGGMRRYLLATAAVGAAFVIPQLAWLLALRGKAATAIAGADPSAQLTYLGDHPIDAAVFLIGDLVGSAPVLARQAVGILGWLDAAVPIGAVVFLGSTVVLVAMSEPGLPSSCFRFRWLAILVFCAGSLALHTMNYIWWTPPALDRVDGIQGRHLLPFVPFLLVSLTAPWWIARPLSRFRPVLIIAFVVVSATATALTIVRRYYLDI